MHPEKMFNYYTSHDEAGKSVYSSKIPEQQSGIKFPGGEMRLLYTTHKFKPNLSTEGDIDQLAVDRVEGIPGGAFFPQDGIATGIVSFEPNCVTPMHRTMSLDIHVCIEGQIECRLDSGEVRRLSPGDMIVMRGTAHIWANVTPNNGYVRMASTSQPITLPLIAGGEEKHKEYHYEHAASAEPTSPTTSESSEANLSRITTAADDEPFMQQLFGRIPSIPIFM